ncbi:MAG: hypothetical protein IJE77_10875, partial [Thermoguttaceae bacterium]|nr:hypothetical protein [Thermoguttaceae bacterium]
ETEPNVRKSGTDPEPNDRAARIAAVALNFSETLERLPSPLRSRSVRRIMSESGASVALLRFP